MKRLNQYRIDAGLSIADIARSADVDESTACRWLCGLAYPEEEHREKLASLFGVDSRDLDEREPPADERRLGRLRNRLTTSGRLPVSR